MKVHKWPQYTWLGRKFRCSRCGAIVGFEAAGVLANDYAIESWDGSRRYRDAANPRTEVTIRRFTEATK